MKQHHAARRIKLIQPGLQLRLAGSFAALCVLALMTQIILLALELTMLTKELPAGGAYLAEELPGMLVRSLLYSALLLLPALFLIGIRTTFKIAGPLYRLEHHLKEVASGKWPGHCNIRKNDELQDFCTLLNKALDSARAQGAAEATGEDALENKSAA